MFRPHGPEFFIVGCTRSTLAIMMRDDMMGFGQC
tara:strand:- start:44 stop:145 length:102 start_codon:yes stop_codon:yes gene_type:complete